MHDASVGWPEPAGVHIEGPEAWLEVDVEPLAAHRLCLLRCEAHDGSPDAAMLMGASRLRVDQESVVSAIPGDIDEAYEEAILGPGGDPAQAVAVDLVPPMTGRPPWHSTSSTISASVSRPLHP